ncbi:DivIVA domain-containing protein [Lacihabitans soyangensis]|uniref:DivIVA domain-containing protein n=1 Tax=Lacihabitans soyangensis TaxID=869394 RepID=A0AAE3H663_9BACT|nr:DivIVA domain-containing protein [Lacihabitans soyangensis]MCP9764716.1 DivIVA domain-containing protein [Lacihabitans soyangensis]
MKITSLEIKQHEFEKSFRGYDIEEVNHFLSNIAQEWERMLNESKMLKMQLDISEKEASKLREVEMTLIKTLRTAEDTSTRLTENAATEAAKKVAEAKQKAAQIIAEAENTAAQLVADAEQKVGDINTAAKAEFAEIEVNFQSIEAQKLSLLNRLKTLASEIDQIVASNTLDGEIPAPETPKTVVVDYPAKSIEMEVEEEEEVVADDEIVDEVVEHEVEEQRVVDDENHGISFSSAVNEINLESSQEDKTNLEIIEGIGPKIKEVLNNARILTFRDLATTPLYRIKDILDAAGSQFAAHDPSTWVEQAMLAESGQWTQLEELKEYLVAGRVPKADIVEEKPKTESVDSGSTEEMLDKVNKVKAAIRKAMVEKAEPKEPKSVNDYIAEKKQSGSFFDNLN